MLEKALILFSGLPGTGKTTLAQRTAQHFRMPLFAKDRLQSCLRVQGLTDRATVDGYLLILDQAEAQLALGMSVILDAVFPKSGFRGLARDIARRTQALFCPIYCVCSDQKLWKSRMENRVAYVPHWTPVGWDDVERLSPEFEPWNDPDILVLDAVESVEDNFLRIVRLLSASQE